MPALGHADPRANVVAHPLVAEAAMCAGEDIKPGFKPVGKALRDLDRLVDGSGRRLGSIVGEAAAGSRFCPGNRVVAVKLDHGSFGRHHVRAIDLNLVVALSVARSLKQATAKKREHTSD